MSQTPSDTAQRILDGLEHLHNVMHEHFVPEDPSRASNDAHPNRRRRRFQRTNRRRRSRRSRRDQHPYERNADARPARRTQHTATPHARWQTKREQFCREIARDMRHELTTDDADTIYMHMGHKTGQLQEVENELETPNSGRSMHQRLVTLCRRNINHLVEQRHRTGGARVNRGDMELIVNYV